MGLHPACCGRGPGGEDDRVTKAGSAGVRGVRAARALPSRPASAVAPACAERVPSGVTAEKDGMVHPRPQPVRSRAPPGAAPSHPLRPPPPPTHVLGVGTWPAPSQTLGLSSRWQRGVPVVPSPAQPGLSSVVLGDSRQMRPSSGRWLPKGTYPAAASHFTPH